MVRGWAGNYRKSRSRVDVHPLAHLHKVSPDQLYPGIDVRRVLWIAILQRVAVTVVDENLDWC